MHITQNFSLLILQVEMLTCNGYLHCIGYYRHYILTLFQPVCMRGAQLIFHKEADVKSSLEFSTIFLLLYVHWTDQGTIFGPRFPQATGECLCGSTFREPRQAAGGRDDGPGWGGDWHARYRSD
jgi:hypothetical protein